MNVLREIMDYVFELGHDAVDATKNICCAKGESGVNHSRVIRSLKKFLSACKNLEDQTKVS